MIDALLAAYRPIHWQGRPVTVGENVIFLGGGIHHRQQRRYPERVLVPSLEFKKVYMDEHAGSFYEPHFSRLVADTLAAHVSVFDRLPELLPGLVSARSFSWR